MMSLSCCLAYKVHTPRVSTTKGIKTAPVPDSSTNSHGTHSCEALNPPINLKIEAVQVFVVLIGIIIGSIHYDMTVTLLNYRIEVQYILLVAGKQLTI